MERQNSEILNFKRIALSLGLCDEYKHKWDSCVSEKELIDIALDSNGVEFLADSFSFGWGMSYDYIKERFSDFINGKYVRNKDGYTSEIYIGYNGAISLRSTITIIVNSYVDLAIPEHYVGSVYVCDHSKVWVHGRGIVDIYEYGDNDVCENFTDPLAITYRVIDKSSWIDNSH